MSALTAPVGPPIVVLSDSDKLARVIAVTLQSRWPIHTYRLDHPTPPDIDLRTFALIIIALSLPYNEPLVILHRAGLIRFVGQVPILIISDRAFNPWPGEPILHLAFPFDSQQLGDHIAHILSAPAAANPRPDYASSMAMEG